MARAGLIGTHVGDEDGDGDGDGDGGGSVCDCVIERVLASNNHPRAINA